MPIFRRRFRSLIWVALIAIFGLALVPTLSQLLAGERGFNPWAEVCSAAGATLNPASASTDLPPSESPRAGLAHLDHCPLCGVAGHAPLLPTAAASVPITDSAGFLPALFAHAPRPLFAWAAAPARGPPAIA